MTNLFLKLYAGLLCENINFERWKAACIALPEGEELASSVLLNINV